MLGSISIIIQIYLKFLLFIHACAFAQSKWSEVSKLDSLTCGKLVTPTSSNKSLKFPEIPSNKQLRESIFNDRKGIRIYQSAIDWKKIKITAALNKLVKSKSNWKYDENNTILQINKEKIPIADNGIQLEWWSKKSKNLFRWCNYWKCTFTCTV